jgi:ABC-type branched-subunit amino acid transport system substrate-binding protein
MRTGFPALVALMTSLVGTTAFAQAMEPIRLGALLPLTGPGAPTGLVAAAGVKMAVQEINQDKGIAGRQIELSMADDQNDTTQGVTEVRRLVQLRNIHFLVGPPNSSVALAAFPILTEAKVASIAYGGSTALTPQAGPYGFTSSPPSEAQAEAMVEYAKKVLKSEAIGILADNGAYSKGWTEEVKKHAAGMGAKVVGTQEFALNAKDMTPELLSLRRAGANVVLLSVVTGADLGNVQVSVANMNWDVKLVGNTAISAFVPVAKQIAGPNAFHNNYGLQLVRYTYCPNDPLFSSPAAKFMQRLKAFDAVQYEKGNRAAAGAMYDNVFILKAAVEASKGATDGPTIAAWIERHSRELGNLVSGVPEPSGSSHFLFGARSLVAVEDVDKPREDGMQRRAYCS